MTAPRLLIIGSGGRLGAALLREYSGKFEIAGSFNHSQLDLAQADEVRRRLDSLGFDILINCAAATNVDRCETEPNEAYAINAEAPRLLAEICDMKKAKLIHFSTDYVFDGEKETPYVEEDAANPVSVYGESKRAGEKKVLQAGGDHLVVRVSWVFGPDRPSFVDAMIKLAGEKDRVEAIGDKFSAPTYTRDLAGALPHFFERGSGGVLHLCNDGAATWQQYAQHALDCCRQNGMKFRTATITPTKLDEMKAFIARRPRYTVLATGKLAAATGQPLRPWQEAVAEYVREYYSEKPQA